MNYDECAPHPLATSHRFLSIHYYVWPCRSPCLVLKTFCRWRFLLSLNMFGPNEHCFGGADGNACEEPRECIFFPSISCVFCFCFLLLWLSDAHSIATQVMSNLIHGSWIEVNGKRTQHEWRMAIVSSSSSSSSNSIRRCPKLGIVINTRNTVFAFPFFGFYENEFACSPHFMNFYLWRRNRRSYYFARSLLNFFFHFNCLLCTLLTFCRTNWWLVELRDPLQRR